jgi:hypothetical protein
MTDQSDRREYVERARAIRRIRHLIEASHLPDLADDLQRLIKEALMWEMGQGVVRTGIALIEQMIAEAERKRLAATVAELPWRDAEKERLQQKLNDAREILRLFNQLKSGEAHDQAVDDSTATP